MKIKRFSKVYILGKAIPVEDLSDKQLMNVAKGDGMTRNSKRVKKSQDKTDILLGVGFGAAGMNSGRVISNRLNKNIISGMAKGGIIGAATGVGTSEILGYYGRKHHRKTAKEAIKELERRKNENNN